MTAAPKRVISALADGSTIETYAYSTGEDQVGDVYYDLDWAPGSRAAVVVVHGGWWHNAARANSANIAAKFRAAGFAVFNIDYRLAGDRYRPDGTLNPGDRWPNQRIDVELAVRFLKTNAAQFGVDPNRIATYGFSAGGHIVSVHAGYYKSVRAAVSIAGIQQPHRTADIVMGYNTADPSSATLVKSFGYMCSAIGDSYEPSWTIGKANWADFKPETYYAADGPAMYIVKGDADPVEPISSLTATEYWLDKAGQDHVTLAVAGRGHDEAMISGSAADDVARWNALLSWLRTKTA